MNDEEKMLRISKRLLELGASPQHLGYYYLIDALMLVMDMPLMSKSVTTYVYPEIAKYHSTSAQGVERCIRTVINHIWNYGNKGLLRQWFIDNPYSKPGNAQFIAVMATYLNLEMKEYIS